MLSSCADCQDGQELRDRDDAPHWRDGGQKIDHLGGMLSTRVEKVETVLDFFDGDGVLVGAVLEDELFEVEEGTLVIDFLPNLDEGAPGVLCR